MKFAPVIRFTVPGFEPSPAPERLSHPTARRYSTYRTGRRAATGTPRYLDRGINRRPGAAFDQLQKEHRRLEQLLQPGRGSFHDAGSRRPGVSHLSSSSAVFPTRARCPRRPTAGAGAARFDAPVTPSANGGTSTGCPATSNSMHNRLRIALLKPPPRAETFSSSPMRRHNTSARAPGREGLRAAPASPFLPGPKCTPSQAPNSARQQPLDRAARVHRRRICHRVGRR